MRSWVISFVLLVAACGKGADPSGKPAPTPTPAATPTPGPTPTPTPTPPAPPDAMAAAALAPDAGAGSAAPAAASGPFVLDDSVAIANDEPCATAAECKPKCGAKQLSACIYLARLDEAKKLFDIQCDAGYAMGCNNMKSRYQMDSADYATWAAKEKAAQANVEAACDAGDVPACEYALPDGLDKPTLWAKACALGSPTMCGVIAEEATTNKVAKGRHASLMFGRACKEQKDASICDRGVAYAQEVSDAAAVTALRKRGAEVAAETCAATTAATTAATLDQCAFEIAFAEQVGEHDKAEAAFARALELASKACKAGTAAGCSSAAGLYLARVKLGTGDWLDLPGRTSTEDPAKPFLGDACRLAWKASPKTQPTECDRAAEHKLDLAKLAPPGVKVGAP